MNNIEKAKEVLEFIDRAIAYEFENTKKLLNFVSAFTGKYLSLQAASKSVYHINLIDELHADENAHSRILAKLLQQETPNGKFEILESFIGYIKEKSKDKTVSFENIHIKNPVITQETERIDLWIRDDDYAIIVENKIHWANDQSEQLSRYIAKTIAGGISEERIFVVYLSPTYDKTPDEQTWGAYKDTFEERFIILSFRDDILSWLTCDVLPNVRLKDKYLSSALEQYIDHLEGMFDLRKINQKINMELQEFFKQELGLSGSPQENFAKLLAKQKEINMVNNQIEALKRDFEKEIFQEWKTYLKTKYPDYPQIAIENGAGLKIQVRDTTVQVVSSIDTGQKLYCQVDMDYLPDKKDRILPQEVIEKAGGLLPEKNDNGQIWKWLPRNAYDETFGLLAEVIQILTA